MNNSVIGRLLGFGYLAQPTQSPILPKEIGVVNPHPFVPMGSKHLPVPYAIPSFQPSSLPVSYSMDAMIRTLYRTRMPPQPFQYFGGPEFAGMRISGTRQTKIERKP